MHKFFFALLVFALGACAHTSGPAPRQDTVVVVSFDGMRWDYPDRVPAPSLAEIARRGTRASLIPIFPSKTFPNHYAIATGMYAEQHGLIGNDFYDRELDAWYGLAHDSVVENPRWYGGEPIWVTAERQGVRTASFFWPGSVAPIGGVLPTHTRRYDESVPDSIRVNTVLEWLRLPAAERPRLVMLYFELVDEAGHNFGPESPQTDSAIVRADRLVANLVEGLTTVPNADRVHFIILADHGMATIRRDGAQYLDDLVELAGVRVVGAGPYTTLDFDGDTLRRNDAEARLRAGLQHAQVYRRDNTPSQWRYSAHHRIADLVVVADEGYTVGTRRALEQFRPGNHGYAPEVRSMHGVFFAAGPRIRAGNRMDAFGNVNVYPLIAELLGIEPAAGISGDLRAVRGMLH